MAQLDARPTSDQEVAGSTPAGLVGNILSWRMILKYFLRSFFSLLLVQEGQLSISGERMCAILFNRLDVSKIDRARHDPIGLTGPLNINTNK